MTTPICSTSVSRRSVSRSEEHTSELQSQSNLVCRLLLEKKECFLVQLIPGEVADGASAALTRPATLATVETMCGFIDSFFLMMGRPRRSAPFPNPAFFR